MNRHVPLPPSLMVYNYFQLLAISILMLAVSEKMPPLGFQLPLIHCFMLSMIVIIFLCTLASVLVIYVQKRGKEGKRLSQKMKRLANLFARAALMKILEEPKISDRTVGQTSKAAKRYDNQLAERE